MHYNEFISYLTVFWETGYPKNVQSSLHVGSSDVAVMMCKHMRLLNMTWGHNLKLVVKEKRQCAGYLRPTKQIIRNTNLFSRWWRIRIGTCWPTNCLQYRLQRLHGIMLHDARQSSTWLQGQRRLSILQYIINGEAQSIETKILSHSRCNSATEEPIQ